MKLFPSFFRQKELVITIHGFGRRTLHEMEPVSAWLESSGFEVKNFAYYDPQDLQGVSAKEWIERCESVVREACAAGRAVHLLGFSMGGVIASYLASVYPVKSLLLAAPAFFPFDFSKVEQAARKKLTSDKTPSMSSEQTKAFMKIVTNYRDSILHAECPVLLLHGTADEVISPSSSRKMFERMGMPQKQLLWIEGAKHRFLYDGTHERLVFPIIRDFFKGEMTD